MAPLIEDGDAYYETVWLSLTPQEASTFRDSLNRWFAEQPTDPGRHFHVGDRYGRTLTVDIMAPEDPRFTPRSREG